MGLGRRAALLPGLGHRVKGQALPRKAANLCVLLLRLSVAGRELYILVYPAQPLSFKSRLSW